MSVDVFNTKAHAWQGDSWTTAERFRGSNGTVAADLAWRERLQREDEKESQASKLKAKLQRAMIDEDEEEDYSFGSPQLEVGLLPRQEAARADDRLGHQRPHPQPQVQRAPWDVDIPERRAMKAGQGVQSDGGGFRGAGMVVDDGFGYGKVEEHVHGHMRGGGAQQQPAQRSSVLIPIPFCLFSAAGTDVARDFASSKCMGCCQRLGKRIHGKRC